jgi:hypothetical protein
VNALLRVEKTLPVQIMHLGFTEMHDLNRPIFVCIQEFRVCAAKVLFFLAFIVIDFCRIAVNLTNRKNAKKELKAKVSGDDKK